MKPFSLNDQSGLKPSERIRNARREIAFKARILSHILTTLETEIKAVERGRLPMSAISSVIDEGLTLTVRHGSALFRELSEVKKAVEEAKERDLAK